MASLAGRALAAGIIFFLAACATPPLNRSAVSSPPDATALPRSIAAKFVSEATAMIGEPYRYGGAAPGGFDCSGLVAYAATHAGLALPRTAHEQMRAGASVARGEVRAGDLVFMRLRSKELHVGIATDSAHFVHAPASGGRVRIDSLEQPPYAGGFLTARRVA